MDGFIYEGSIDNINPNDVCIITILIDFAAFSIYGSVERHAIIIIAIKKSLLQSIIKSRFSSLIVVSPDQSIRNLVEIFLLISGLTGGFLLYLLAIVMRIIEKICVFLLFEKGFMKNKLNITIDETLIEEAKRYAAKNKTSLSQLIEDGLKKLVQPRLAKKQNILELMKTMPKPKGKVPEGDLRKLYYESRRKKYGF